jgi:P27 family predicted phage terminase small subunit
MKTNVQPLFAKPELPKMPKGLSHEARQFWKAIIDEYQLDDAAGLKLLQRACEALTRIKNAQKLIKEHGELVPDRGDSIKANPAVAIEKDAHRQFIEALKCLNLDLEPLKAIGRPGKKI